MNMVNILYAGLIPFTVIATKADKVSRMAGMNGVKNIAATLKCGTDDVILTSSQTRLGLEKVYERIERVISLYGSGEEREEDMMQATGEEE